MVYRSTISQKNHCGLFKVSGAIKTEIGHRGIICNGIIELHNQYQPDH